MAGFVANCYKWQRGGDREILTIQRIKIYFLPFAQWHPASGVRLSGRPLLLFQFQLDTRSKSLNSRASLCGRTEANSSSRRIISNSFKYWQNNGGPRKNIVYSKLSLSGCAREKKIILITQSRRQNEMKWEFSEAIHIYIRALLWWLDHFQIMAMKVLEWLDAR